MENKVFKTKTAKLWVEKGILHCRVFPGAKITIENAREIMDVSLRLANGKKVPVLGDMRNVKSIPKESRDYLSGKEATKTASSLALLIESPISKIIGNFLMGLNKPSYPVKLFTAKNEAIQWLKGFIN
jgi:hypothetical protein